MALKLSTGQIASDTFADGSMVGVPTRGIGDNG